MVYCKFSFISKTLYFILLTLQSVTSDRTSMKIYESIQGDIFCFRRLNATHQIGCASNRNGNIGIVHAVESVDDIQWIIQNGTNPPYVVALPMNFFNMDIMTVLRNSERVTGVLILKENGSKPTGFSPDQSCPNRNFDLYSANETFSHLSVKWNPNNPAISMMYEDWKMPVFLITQNDSITSIIKDCYERFNKPENGVDQKWPLCAAQLKSGMMAAKDSSTCMRRSKLVTNINPMKVCDPLSDRNIVTMLFHANKSEEIANRSVIVVGARLDAFSLFDRLAPGAHTAVTGLVSLLAVAHTISMWKDSIKTHMQDGNSKNILFAIFNGEAFDYIGSSRIVFDMNKGVFPVEIIKSIPHQQAPVSLHHISHFIELSQLAPPSNDFWLHVDPISTMREEVNTSVNELIEKLKNQTSGISVNLKRVSQQQLPPASIQSFLKHDDEIAGVVIADHEKVYLNKYYNSIFDTIDENDIPALSIQLANLATIVSRTLYNILTDGKNNESIITNETLIEGMLNCYLINASCNLFHEIADPDKTGRLRDDPYPLYVSVESGNRMNAITAFTRYLLAYLTGIKLENFSRADCTLDSNDQIYQYDWMVGSDTNSSGICVKSTVMYTLAVSPAFVLDDWHSTIYSTWTESVWEEISVRIFLRPSRLQEGLTLAVGIVTFIISILVVYFANKRASILFGVRNLVGC